ncbi:cytochrome P450 [Schizophyllum fasciatum]
MPACISSQLASWSRRRFPKPIQRYTFLQVFGNNIVASEFEEWKYFRKIAAPAFSDRNNALVWEEAISTADSLIRDAWKDAKEVHLTEAHDLTLSMALFVIGAFGRSISWEDDGVVPPGHAMSFKEAMVCASTNVPLYIMCPDWFPGFSQNLRRVRVAFAEIEKYMSEMVEERRSSMRKKGEERNDLLTRFLEENDKDDDAMDFRGILCAYSHSFLSRHILMRFYQTLAHTLCFAFALLALHPEEQDKLYEHVKSVYPADGSLPTFDDMNKFTQTLAVFYETLRMFPPVVSVPKISAEDQIVTGTRLSDGSKITIPCPAGTDVTFSVAGLHYNPTYWDAPHEFRPDRFKGDWPKDAFVPFAVGSRSCLGRKFAETEGVAILSVLIAKYKVEVMEEAQFAGESHEQRHERVLRATGGLTLTPVRVPLTFRRRD